MDPASATVAFVGFAASITTLAAVLFQSCKTLRDLCHDLHNAPQDLHRLLRNAQTLEKVVLQVKRTGAEIANEESMEHIDAYWMNNVKDMERDLEVFNKKVSKLQKSLEKPSITSLQVKARFYKVFSESDIEQYERQLSQHRDTFTMLYSMVSNERSKKIMEELHLQSKKLDRLASSANTFHATMKNELRATQKLLSEENKVVINTVKREVRTLNYRLPNEETILSQLQLHGAELATLAPSSEELLPGYEEPPPTYLEAMTESASSTQVLVSCKFLSAKLPLGILTIRKSSTQAWTKGNGCDTNEWSQSSSKIEFSLFPVPWLTKTVVHLSFGLKGRGDATPDISWKLKQRHYNSDPRLMMNLNLGNVSAIQEMFRKREASPHDLIAPWGNTLLHEAVKRLAAGIPNMLELSFLLLKQGTDPNIQNAKGCTALVQVCHLMGQSPQLCDRLRPVADVIIQHNADLTISDQEGNSACTLIFQNRGGLSYLEEFVYRYIDLLALHDMETVDYWLITALARAYPTFRRCLEAENESFRTAPRLALKQARPSASLTELDLSVQMESIKNAEVKHRTRFLQSLCAKGTLEMVKPFLAIGLDLNEIEAVQHQTYLRAAGRAGNMEVVDALMKAGASVDGVSDFNHPYSIVNGVVDEIFDRWNCLRHGRPDVDAHGHSEGAEFWILPRLLQNPTFNDPNALLLAVWYELDYAIFETLLDHGCGRRDGQKPMSWQLRRYGSEVIEAIKCDNPVVTRMLEHGLALEVEDGWGCTALIHALDKGIGRENYTQAVVTAGADLERRTGCGYTPLEFAETNMRARHPRMPQRTWNTKSLEVCNSRLISVEEDRATYIMLKRAIGERKGHRATLKIPSSNDSFFSIRSVLHSSYIGIERDWSDVQLTVLGTILTALSLVWVKMVAALWKLFSTRRGARTKL
ncbi:hypothetical protein DPSP01_002558 [Paraphaeosphaeria sporulosa]